MVTECWLGFLMGSNGSSTLREVAGVWIEVLQVGALIYTYAHGVCLCVCMFTYMYRGFPCV